MAQAGQEKRVKVYELKNGDWYDRGTGFCTGQLMSPTTPEDIDGRILVHSEEEPSRTLLETRIIKDDGYQKQQETLIVWTEANGVDMALSFQEAEGCSNIWQFISDIQSRLAALGPEDTLSDDHYDTMNTIVLPEPAIGRLDEIEANIRMASVSPATRDGLAKFIMHPDQMYIMKLAPLVTIAEDLESLADLHKLCMIMKNLILLNDTAIIEFIVTDSAIMGVVGALEYDPDFPNHRANHRQYLSDTSKFKEVVPIEDEEIRRKIHWTYRLLYLKDVVLARILDDPTFSVLNSLIFFHQVDIVNHIQSNQDFLLDLFAIFKPEEHDLGRKKEAVHFIQNCCAVSKNIQQVNRNSLYSNFIGRGLFTVITFALRHQDCSVRVAGTDILVSLIDHDPHMVRNHIFAMIREKQVPLTDTLIELLLVEEDLGVKSQMADAIKILLDPVGSIAGIEMMNRAGNADIVAKQRAGGANAALHNQNPHSAQTLAFIESFYEGSAKRLFATLKNLEHPSSVANLSMHDAALYTHLIEILCFFVRQHQHRSKSFILGQHLHGRIATLLHSPQRYMKLAALKWFRTCVGLQDEFHNRQIISFRLFDSILTIVEETMPRDNLLNSACLELFEYIKREVVKQLVVHLVENYRERLMRITYVNTFHALILKYDQLASGEHMVNGQDESFSTQEGTPQRLVNGRQAFSGLKEMDNDEQAYFDTEDDVEDDDESLPMMGERTMMNGASPVRPLVNYPDDDEDSMELLASSPDVLPKDSRIFSSNSDRKVHLHSGLGDTDDFLEDDTSASPLGKATVVQPESRTAVSQDGSPGRQVSPPESIAMKRRREDAEDDDELGKMMGGVKRRNSSVSSGSNKPAFGLDGTSHPAAETTSNPGLESRPESVSSSVDADLADDTPDGPHPSPAPSQTSSSSGAPALRRKGSLKTRNEAASTSTKFSIKPVTLPSNVSSAPVQQGKDGGQKNGANG